MPYPPISPEDLARLHELGAAEHNLQQRLYDLELAKLPVLAAGKRIRAEQDAVYLRIAEERGLPPEAVPRISVNMKTGEVRVSSEPDVAASSDVVLSPE